MQQVRLSNAPQTASDQAAQTALKAQGSIPVHIACIMDGNGRWAKQRGQMRVFGHHEGIESVRDITEACAQLGVQHLTLYTFSTENWNRPPAEVIALMELLVRTLRREAERLNANNIRLNAIGDLGRLPARCEEELREGMALTQGNTRMTLNLALSYSGRWELTEAVRALAQEARDGRLDPAAVTEQMISDRLQTAGLPDPDLLIRTGGEHRISNFLLWQLAYTEIFVAPQFWPDFRREALYTAIRDFQQRERRFGRVLDAVPT